MGTGRKAMRPNRAATPDQVGVTGRKAMRPRRATPGQAGKVKEMTIDRRKEEMGEMEVMAGITSVEGTISNRKGVLWNWKSARKNGPDCLRNTRGSFYALQKGIFLL